MASEIARKMVCAYGMSEAFGFQSFGDNQETIFLGREVARTQAYSEDTAKKIDEEVERIVTEMYARAEKLLSENRAKLELLVENLLEAETMDGRDVEDLLKHGRILNEAERELQAAGAPLPEQNASAPEEDGKDAEPPAPPPLQLEFGGV